MPNVDGPNGFTPVRHLTGGTIRVSGNFSQTSANSTTSFAAGTGHSVLFDGSSQGVSFASPGTALSRFGSVDVTNSTSIQPSTDVVVAGNLSLTSGTQWTIASGTTLDVNTNLFELSGATIAGTGTLDVSDFTSTVARVRLDGDVSPAGSGTIGTLSVIGHIWLGGSYSWDHAIKSTFSRIPRAVIHIRIKDHIPHQRHQGIVCAIAARRTGSHSQCSKNSIGMADTGRILRFLGRGVAVILKPATPYWQFFVASFSVGNYFKEVPR